MRSSTTKPIILPAQTIICFLVKAAAPANLKSLARVLSAILAKTHSERPYIAFRSETRYSQSKRMSVYSPIIRIHWSHNVRTPLSALTRATMNVSNEKSGVSETRNKCVAIFLWASGVFVYLVTGLTMRLGFSLCKHRWYKANFCVEDWFFYLCWKVYFGSYLQYVILGDSLNRQPTLRPGALHKEAWRSKVTTEGQELVTSSTWTTDTR